ncbi:MAG TPA: BON domain-containing protein [Candidatus Udaeobacter sp.]
MRMTQTIKRTSLVIASVTAISMAALAADEKTNPDNTGINERDRSGDTNTSGDQSNSSADLKVTQAIRRAIMQDSQLSMTAKNIKIVTANGKVTLRGPVNNAEEKAKIGQLANSSAGGARIDNQLDVKGSK